MSIVYENHLGTRFRVFEVGVVFANKSGWAIFHKRRSQNKWKRIDNNSYLSEREAVDALKSRKQPSWREVEG